MNSKNIESIKRKLSFEEQKISKRQSTFDYSPEAVPYDLENDPDKLIGHSSIEQKSNIQAESCLENYQLDESNGVGRYLEMLNNKSQETLYPTIFDNYVEPPNLAGPKSHDDFNTEQSEMASSVEQSEMEERVAPGFEIEELNAEQPRVSTRFRRDEYNFDFGITHNFHHLLPNLLEASKEISDVYERMVLPTLKKYPSDHKYCVFIKHAALKQKPIYIAGSTIEDFDSSEFLTAIYKVSQSNEEFLLSGQVKVTVKVKKTTLTGSGRNKYNGAPRTTEKRKKYKNSFVEIKNDEDNLCGYRAVYVCVMYHVLEIKKGIKDQYQWRKIKEGKKPKKIYTVDVQKDGALQICRDANMPSNQPLTLSRMIELQDKYLTPRNYQLIVIDGRDAKNTLFKGPQEQQQIYLEYSDNHYNAILEMNQFLETLYYCVACNTGYQSTHKCSVKCQLCGREPKCQIVELIKCDICSRVFNNQQCYNSHKPLLCLNIKRCSTCELDYNYFEKDKHKCDQSSCKLCGEKYEVSPHYCYIKKLDIEKLEKEDKKIKIIVCYDIESIQVCVEKNKYQHKAYLLIAEIVCDMCWNVSEKRKLSDCEYCGPFNKRFIGLDCIKKFGDYVYKDLAKKAAKLKSKVLVFAHNSSGYDGHFVFTDLFKRGFEDTNIIMKGLKILLIDVANVRFLDSLSFFQQPLAQLPKSFGISEYTVKGFFPHLFSKMENLKHVGSLPPLQDYGIKYMKKSTADDLRKWYNEISQNNDYIFNYENELIKYCSNDVRILTMSVMLYRQLFKSVTRIDPVTRNFTLASVGFDYFRAAIMKDKTIGICPLKGYSKQRNQSKSANIYLDYMQKSNNSILREQHKGCYFVDGYIPEDNKIIEFFGCKWHGCPKCYKINRDIPLKELNNLSYSEAYNNTMEKLAYFNRRNFDKHFIWECEYKTLRKENPQIEKFHKHRQNYYDDLEIYGAAEIRESFFGGCTNNLYFTYDCKDYEKIGYVDFTSLYPYVLVSNSYPIGHPKVISEFNSTDISEYFGFIKCIVLPPTRLYLGILPSRINKKLYFPLCKTCAELNNNETCEHEDEDRCIIGTWTSIEMNLAIQKGYIIKKLIQVLHYEEKSNQIFQPYIRTWLKIKTEASGWPKTCTTQEAKDKFIRDFEVREGIELDSNNMVKNEGLRYIAKLKLNTLWGKLGQNPNQIQTKMCNNYDDYAKIDNDPSIIIKGEFMPTENTLIVNYKHNEAIFDNPGNTSPAIASFVTAYARLKLYSELDKLEESESGRILYFDTDSIFYIYRTDIDQYNPSTGDFLGDLTDEIWKDYETEGAYISRFASSGPKNYGYKVTFPNGSSKTKCKIKGITLTDEVEKELNFDIIYNFANDYTKGVKTRKNVPQQQFRADQHHNVYTLLFDKAYRVVSEKRRQVGNRTLPYGYKD